MTQLNLSVAAAVAIAVQSIAPQAAPPIAGTVPDSGTPVARLGNSTYVDLEAGVGYGTNPQLRILDSQAEGFGRASVHLVHTRKSERAATILSAYGENITYTGNGKSQQLVIITAHHDAAVSERLRVFSNLSASLNSGGQLGNRFVNIPVSGLLSGPVIGPTLPPPDVTFLSVNDREYHVGGQLGLVAQVNARDTLTVTGEADYGFSRGGFRRHYAELSGLAGYERRLNERWTLGARVGVDQANYSNAADSTIFTPQATAHYQVSERWNVFGAIGASIADVKSNGISDRSTGLALDAGLCHQGKASSMCGHVSRSQQRATTFGPVKLLSFDLDYSRRLDAKQTIQLSAGISRSTSTANSFALTVPFTNVTYVRSAAVLTRELNTKLFGGVNVGARKFTQIGPDPKADVSGFIFLRYRLGDVR